MSWQIRSLASALTGAIVALYGILLKQGPLEWSVLVAIALVSLVMIWVHQPWWTHLKYALLVGLLIALTLLLALFNTWSPYSSVLLLPLVLVLARDVQRYPRFTALLAAVTMAVMAVLASLSALTFLPWVIGSYLSVRGINTYKELSHLGQLHLQELDTAHQALKQAHEELQEATVHSMRYAALAERARLAREMHDGLGHHLTSLIVQLQAVEIMLPNEPGQAAQAIPSMISVARSAMVEVRQAVREWTEDESQLGIVALQGLVSQSAAHSPLAFEFRHDGDLCDWPMEISVALYRILQEAITNIVRHARATTATIEVQERNQQIILTICDNGCYTAERELVPGFGLQGIRERCQALSGSCTLSENQPSGLQVQVILPNTLSTPHAIVARQAFSGKLVAPFPQAHPGEEGSRG